MASAVTLADSLKSNHTLVSLGLAYNSFSDYASQVMTYPDPQPKRAVLFFARRRCTSLKGQFSPSALFASLSEGHRCRNETHYDSVGLGTLVIIITLSVLLTSDFDQLYPRSRVLAVPAGDHLSY